MLSHLPAVCCEPFNLCVQSDEQRRQSCLRQKAKPTHWNIIEHPNAAHHMIDRLHLSNASQSLDATQGVFVQTTAATTCEPNQSQDIPRLKGDDSMHTQNWCEPRMLATCAMVNALFWNE